MFDYIKCYGGYVFMRLKTKILTKVISAVCVAVVATSCVAMPVGAVRGFDKSITTYSKCLNPSWIGEVVSKLNDMLGKCDGLTSDIMRDFSKFVENVDGSDANKEILKKLGDIRLNLAAFNDLVIDDTWWNDSACSRLGNLLSTEIPNLQDKVKIINEITDVQIRVICREEINSGVKQIYDTLKAVREGYEPSCDQKLDAIYENKNMNWGKKFREQIKVFESWCPDEFARLAYLVPEIFEKYKYPESFNKDIEKRLKKYAKQLLNSDPNLEEVPATVKPRVVELLQKYTNYVPVEQHQ